MARGMRLILDSRDAVILEGAVLTSMNPDPEWTFAGAVPDGQLFEIDGIDVWKHEWKNTKERIDVEDPLYHQRFSFVVYEIRNEDKSVRFAAGEFSNGIFGFYTCTGRKP